jgi:two-component system OmpR family response regulator
MPNVDGIELVNWIRSERGMDVPVLMLSSRCDQAELTERLAGRATRVLPKPFSPSRLVSEIESLLDGTPARG